MTLDEYTIEELKEYLCSLIYAEDLKEVRKVSKYLEKRIKEGE